MKTKEERVLAWRTHCRSIGYDSDIDRKRYAATTEGAEAFLACFGMTDHKEARDVILKAERAIAQEQYHIEYGKARAEFPHEGPGAWKVIAENALCRQKLVPPGWDKTITCRNCGVMPSDFKDDGQVFIACPWCSNA